MTTTQQPKPEIAIPAWVPPIFLDACGDHRQFDVNTPFAENGFLWATDGTILVRRKLTDQEYDAVPGRWSFRKRLPNAGGVWEQFAFAQNHPWCVTLPPGDYGPTECSKCGGQGIDKLGLECDECDGEGMIESCFRVTCGDTRPVVLLSRYVGLLLKHGIRFVTAGTPQQPVYFAGSGFEGVLMTCTEEKP